MLRVIHARTFPIRRWNDLGCSSSLTKHTIQTKRNRSIVRWESKHTVRPLVYTEIHVTQCHPEKAGIRPWCLQTTHISFVKQFCADTKKHIYRATATITQQKARHVIKPSEKEIYGNTGKTQHRQKTAHCAQNNTQIARAVDHSDVDRNETIDK